MYEYAQNYTISKAKKNNPLLEIKLKVWNKTKQLLHYFVLIHMQKKKIPVIKGKKNYCKFFKPWPTFQYVITLKDNNSQFSNLFATAYHDWTYDILFLVTLWRKTDT